MSLPGRCLFVAVVLVGFVGTVDDFIAGGDLASIAAGFWIVLVLFVLGFLFVIDQAAQGLAHTFRRSRR